MINVQQRNADEQQRSVAARSKKTQEEVAQCKKLADAAMRDLASAMPALEEAVKVRGRLLKAKRSANDVSLYFLMNIPWVIFLAPLENEEVDDVLLFCSNEHFAGDFFLRLLKAKRSTNDVLLYCSNEHFTGDFFLHLFKTKRSLDIVLMDFP